MEIKQQMLKAIQELPDDASVEDALDRLYLLYKIEKGLRQADGGELISREDVRQRMAKWLNAAGRRRSRSDLSIHWA
jgi:predicted transcriptional regulator